MSETNGEHMVLRTVYMPHTMETWLKRAAFKAGKSKGELIRTALSEWLTRKFPHEHPVWETPKRRVRSTYRRTP